MTEHKCPCCGQDMDGPTPAALLDAVKLSPMERRVLDHLVSIFPRATSSRAIADAIYWDDINGGPDGAENCVAVFTSHVRRKINAYGWDVGGGRGVRGGYGLRRVEAAAA